jgi:hypothetical protein
MADFYSILAKAVSALDGNTAQARRRLYERARAAVIVEMREATPALSQSDILVARISLEEAIGKVEAEAQGDRRSHRLMATPSTPLPRGGVEAASSRPPVQTAEHGNGKLMRFWTRVLRRDGEGAPGGEIRPRGGRSEGPAGHSWGKADSGQGRDSWLSEVLARASRDEHG